MNRTSAAVTWGAVGLTALGGLVLPGCERVPLSEQPSRAKTLQVDPYALSESARAETKAARLAAVRDVGNGVYVFPAHYFPETLADFRAEHPHLKLYGVTQGNAMDGALHGHQSGCPINFFVITSGE